MNIIFCIQALSHKTLVMLLGFDPCKMPSEQPLPSDQSNPQVTFAYMKHMWKNNQKVFIVMGYCIEGQFCPHLFLPAGPGAN